MMRLVSFSEEEERPEPVSSLGRTQRRQAAESRMNAGRMPPQGPELAP